MALACMHNLAPDELKVTKMIQKCFKFNNISLFKFKNAAGLCVSFSKKNG